MPEINFKPTKIYQALKLKGLFRVTALLQKILFLALIVVPLIFLFWSSDSAAGFFLLFSCLFAITFLLNCFFNQALSQAGPLLPLEQALGQETINLADFLDFGAARTVLKTQLFSPPEKFHPAVLAYFLFDVNPELEFIFSRALLSFKSIKKELKSQLSGAASGPELKILVWEAAQSAKEKNQSLITAGNLLEALVEKTSVLEKYLNENNLLARDIKNLSNWLASCQQEAEARKGFWKRENLAKLGSFGRDWASGYSVLLDQYSTDWTELAKKQSQQPIGHAEEIKTLETILSQDILNNALLVGQPGVGKKNIVRILAQKVSRGESLPSLNYKRIVEINLPALLSAAPDEEITESVLDRVFSEVITAGNIILVINELQDFVGSIKRPGVTDITGLLAKYLKTPGFRFIGLCTSSGFHKYIEQNSSFVSLFRKINVPEISEQETLLVLQREANFYERKYKKFISYQALRDIVNYSRKYISEPPLPQKAINLLDEVISFACQEKKTKIVLAEHAARVMTEKIKIPVGKLQEKEKDILLNLEGLIHQRIVNQEEAVSEVAEALRRTRSEITTKKGPIGAFLFLGPTGVGKTETAKAVTDIYFGAKERMVRLDMSEFQETKDIPRLIGGPNEEGLLTTQIKQKPFCLLLLDEIEKAHPNILNLFLQIIDEGHVTDGIGRKIDFKNAIIVATSNAGYKVILEALKKRTRWSLVKERLLNYIFENAIFRPEFINRFDAVVIFKPLSKQNLLDIAQLMLNSLEKNLKEKHVEFEITQELKEKIVELSYNPIFGAREMKRVIQDKVENTLAVALLQEEIKKGDKITMDKNFKVSKI